MEARNLPSPTWRYRWKIGSVTPRSFSPAAAVGAADVSDSNAEATAMRGNFDNMFAIETGTLLFSGLIKKLARDSVYILQYFCRKNTLKRQTP